LGAKGVGIVLGRLKGGKNLKTQEKKEIEKKQCTACKAFKHPTNDYYISNSRYQADQRHSVCKSCLREDVSLDDLESVKRFLFELNRPFISALWQSTLLESENKKSDPIGLYVKNCQISYKELTWIDSDKELNNEKDIVFSEVKIQSTEMSEQRQDSDQQHPKVATNDKQNEEDVLRMLGYDPFEYESQGDRRHLFNKLVDYLDESTLEDSFKLPAVIEIVKSFSQIDKINSALSHITSSTKSVTENVGGITSLVNAKEKMLKSVLALAKDNGISVNHNNNKSKGAGTLSGIIKQLHEKGIESAEINIYDIETCEGMRQVADISNKSIMDQLMLNENDYTEMIKEQRDMILKFEEKVSHLEEENRLLKIKIKQYE
jgi:hypothetical protein